MCQVVPVAMSISKMVSHNLDIMTHEAIMVIHKVDMEIILIRLGIALYILKLVIISLKRGIDIALWYSR